MNGILEQAQICWANYRKAVFLFFIAGAFFGGIIVGAA